MRGRQSASRKRKRTGRSGRHARSRSTSVHAPLKGGPCAGNGGMSRCTTERETPCARAAPAVDFVGPAGCRARTGRRSASHALSDHAKARRSPCTPSSTRARVERRPELRRRRPSTGPGDSPGCSAHLLLARHRRATSCDRWSRRRSATTDGLQTSLSALFEDGLAQRDEAVRSAGFPRSMLEFGDIPHASSAGS